MVVIVLVSVVAFVIVFGLGLAQAILIILHNLEFWIKVNVGVNCRVSKIG